jgi:hypothetical protein
MPIYQYKCNGCGETSDITASIRMPTPNPPHCYSCHRVMVRKYSPFGFTPIEIEISGPGGKFGSKRAYNTDRDRRSEEHSERVGREVTFESFDPRDPDQDPRKPLK